MRVLVDNCVPRQFAVLISGHDVATTAGLALLALLVPALLRLLPDVKPGESHIIGG